MAETTEFMLGKIEGQLLEFGHTLNNVSQEMRAVQLLLGRIEPLIGEVADLRRRVGELETDKHKRDGALGFGGWLVKSPLVGWLVAAAVALLTAWKAKVL